MRRSSRPAALGARPPVAHSTPATFYTRMNSRSDLALVAVNLSTILVDRGDLPGAKQKAEQALSISRSKGEKSYAAYALMAVADVEAKRGDLARAEAIVRDALRQRREMGEQSTVAESQLALAELAAEQERFNDAEALAREALVTFEKDQRSDVTAVAKTILARTAIARRQLSAARQLLRDAEPLATSSGEMSAQFAVALTEAKLAIASAKPAVARTQPTALLERATVPQQLEARVVLAQANLAAGRTAEARSQLEVLEWDATKEGFALIARKAVRLRTAGVPAG